MGEGEEKKWEEDLIEEKHNLRPQQSSRAEAPS